jgi:hypothetical protein
MKHISAVALAFSLLAVPARAADAPHRLQSNSHEMDTIELSATLPGMTMTGNYGNGVKFTETYHPDGSVTYFDDGSADHGRWFVRGRLFCTFYDASEGACFSVRKSGDNCYEYFTQEYEDGSLHRDRGAWNSVGWDKDKSSSCDLADKVS